MATVVGLVRSRLRSKSRRGRSIDGFESIVDGNGCVTQRSLRQFALAEPTDEDSALSPSSLSTASRSPTALDPIRLAEGLTTSPNISRTSSLDAPPVPPLPTSVLPLRQSSLQNRQSIQINSHRRTLSQSSDKPRMPLESLAERPPRRHDIISSPAQQPPEQKEPEESYFPEMPSKQPSTLTARLYGRIADRSPVRHKDHAHTRSNSTTSSEKPTFGDKHRTVPERNCTTRSRRPPNFSTLTFRPRAATYDGPKSPSFLDEDNYTYLPPTKEEQTVVVEDPEQNDEIRASYSEHTGVDTVIHPAVEKQVLHLDKTEVTHSTVERDVHIHHHYEYTQPIKVVEVLPPKHYRIDERTGAKIEIDPPPGWIMPQPLVTTAPDVSSIKSSQRHYVVNEQYPDGKLEDWPLKEEPTTWI
jgi:hypothetical protein